jgi:hypothetical protein
MKRFIMLSLGLLLMADLAYACDICAIYASLSAREFRRGGYVSFYQQYTRFGTLREDGVKIENDEDQYLRSAISQVAVGYQFQQRLGVQVNASFINRTFQRPEDEAIVSGSERGLGDVAVTGHYRMVQRFRPASALIWNVYGGVKLPTGSSNLLAEDEHGEEHHEGETHNAKGTAVLHGGESGVHNHDLALGSGSVDGLLGTSGMVVRNRFFTGVNLQYALRTEGDHDYRYANDLSWSFSPGYYAFLRHNQSLSVGAMLSGEVKGEDTHHGEKADDTALTAVYLGPHLTYSHHETLHAELAVEVPLTQDNSSLQIVPDTRLRLAVTRRF